MKVNNFISIIYLHVYIYIYIYIYMYIYIYIYMKVNNRNESDNMVKIEKQRNLKVMKLSDGNWIA